MQIRLAPPCLRCGQPYLSGVNGVCSKCRSRGKRKRDFTPRTRRLRCDCGQPAVAVILVDVGMEATTTVRLAVCAECLSFEQDDCPTHNLALTAPTSRVYISKEVLRSRDESWIRVDWP